MVNSLFMILATSSLIVYVYSALIAIISYISNDSSWQVAAFIIGISLLLFAVLSLEATRSEPM